MMKTLVAVAVFLAVLLAGGCGGWTKQDTLRELSFTTVTTADWYQTESITRDCVEMNPVIGKCGNGPVGVNTEMPAAIALHAVVSAVLPPTARKWWQYLTTAGEVITVGNNYRIGYDWHQTGPATSETSSSFVTVQPTRPSL